MTQWLTDTKGEEVRKAKKTMEVEYREGLLAE